MTNTEKPTGIAEQKKMAVETPKQQKMETNVPKNKNAEPKGSVIKTDKEKNSEDKADKSNESTESKKEEKKQPVQKKPKVKKTQGVVNANNLHISTKKSAAICKFIKNKRIGDAIRELEEVIPQKRAIPMKGEIPHKKGKGMMSGGYPKKATQEFIKLLKNLAANCNVNELNDPVIVEAVANIGARPYGRFGRWRKKRTHVRIVAREKKLNSKKKSTKKNGGKKK